jgi:hypothetical protein
MIGAKYDWRKIRLAQSMTGAKYRPSPLFYRHVLYGSRPVLTLSGATTATLLSINITYKDAIAPYTQFLR